MSDRNKERTRDMLVMRRLLIYDNLDGGLEDMGELYDYTNHGHRPLLSLHAHHVQ